ncbi:hypothetical protein [Acinetobacter oleivorans]|nr:hypothetical protein [Acinetobacter oleivorans]
MGTNDPNAKPERPPKIDGPPLVVSTESFKIQDSKRVITEVKKEK